MGTKRGHMGIRVLYRRVEGSWIINSKIIHCFSLSLSGIHLRIMTDYPRVWTGLQRARTTQLLVLSMEANTMDNEIGIHVSVIRLNPLVCARDIHGNKYQLL